MIADIASWVLLGAGAFFCVVGGIGLIRMPDFYTRLHAASVTDTLGVGFVLAGLALQAGWSLTTAKLAVIFLLVLFTSPAATHAVAKAARSRGLEPLLGRRENRS